MAMIAETERLILRQVCAGDAPALEAVFCDPEVMRYSERLRSPAWVRDWISAVLTEQYPLWGFGPWAVVTTADRAVIGYCGLSREPGRCAAGEAELGYRLARTHWRKGYGGEAAAAACEHGLGELGLARIIAIIDPQNLASVTVARKLGMCYEREIIFPGYSHPDHLYARRRPSCV